jgi:predicted naringenin-chalcone synthase
VRIAPAVLREYGNIWGLMIGLGPGFAAEGALLRW